MFGLTKREQRWKAEQEALETLCGLIGTGASAAAAVRGAEEKSEVERLRAENSENRNYPNFPRNRFDLIPEIFPGMTYVRYTGSCATHEVAS